ncbi:MAG TPA: beta-glucosidase [Parvularcula sp.]|nr:beta-glucosidase [Parvularcula sp.]HBS31775.1 beta-glucosidase [Parvularcula sp.]
MTRIRISRRSLLTGTAVALAWTLSPLAPVMRRAEARVGPASRDAIKAIIKSMTLEEKAGQLTLMPSAWGGGVAAQLNPPAGNSNFAQQIEDAVAGRLTGVFNGNGAAMAKRMQEAVMERSRLKVPLIFAADVIHGHRTIFPVGVGEAASFEPSLAERTARVAAYEAAGSGIDWTFAPMVDIARDQRWGRAVEGAGEDVLLGKLFAAARVRGFQGKNLADDDAVMACIKHFAAYGAAESGLDYNVVDMSISRLFEVYLPPYRAGVGAGAGSVMSAFNELNGVPATGNKWLQTGILRDEWGFDGFVVSDYTSDEEMIAAGYAADRREAARLAFLAGVDMSMTSGVYIEHLPGLVRDGEISEKLLDRSVQRVLAAKAALGLFDDPFRRIDLEREKQRSRRPESLALAREAAQKSVVLLKNEKDLLPLSRKARIALVGPFARAVKDSNGPWVVYGDNSHAVDLALGLKNAGADFQIADGSGVEAPIPGGIEDAVALARRSDVVVLAIGEGERMSGEAQSRADITLPAPQQALAEAVAGAGKPVVVVLRNGRALALHGAVRQAGAILVTWFLGSESGNAIADILFGDVSPSGRLPISFPHESGQQPFYYSRKNTGRPNPDGPLVEYKTHFRETANRALYPFGHGLTYGDIQYDAFGLSASKLGSGSIEAKAVIRNAGRRAAVETVQLYTHQRTASMTRPIRELRAFQKIDLAPGEEKTVRFLIAAEELAFVNAEGRPVREPGIIDVWIAPSAEAEGVRGAFEFDPS